MTKIYIDEKICTGCGICIEFCPKKVLAHSSQRSFGSIYQAQATNVAACTYCQLCELYCPAFAISVDEKEDE